MADEHGAVEWEPVEPFDIDDGELDGIRPQVVWCLDVEWQMLHVELDSGREVARTIHVENTSRVEKMCQRRGRQFEITPHDSEWSFLRVEAM